MNEENEKEVAAVAAAFNPGHLTPTHLLNASVYMADATRRTTEALLRVLTQEAMCRLLHEERFANPARLERYGFKVFSQNDEDGILQEILRRIGADHRMFFEFGSGNGLENCTHYLLAQGWSGVWADTDTALADATRKTFESYAESLRVETAHITAENINSRVDELRLPENLDVLVIDIDGNDYYVWEALEAIKPRIVVIEYNASLPPPVRLVQAYNPELRWNGTRYFGASLMALADLGVRKGYQLVGCNISGVNAFFVRQELARDGAWDRSLSPVELFHPPRFELGFYGFGGHPAGVGPWRAFP